MSPDVASKLFLRALVSTYLCDYFWNICWDQVVHIDSVIKESMYLAAKDNENGGYLMFPIKAGKFKKSFSHPWDLYRVVFKAGFNDGILRKCEAQVLWKRPTKEKNVFHRRCDPPVKSVHSGKPRHTLRSEIDIRLLKAFVKEKKNGHTKEKLFQY
ncbi:uncharacterized protein LOC123539009 [Mercenaria mercenaria]|uniref:uncharacterized protein LOC123539009 n=1 Tax=Mercenaria mercenaria TaxID=6596 RepID=UPI001E1D9700|nr:uncharacterized protein LOC123539009 [Mercenaria mercenaria]